MTKPLNRGFSLIEIIIVIAIIAILMTIGINVYQNHTRKANRQSAITALLHLQLQEERYHNQHGQYGKFDDISLPKNRYYDLAISNVSATTYSLTATAKSNSPQIDDHINNQRCSSLRVNQQNMKTPIQCW